MFLYRWCDNAIQRIVLKYSLDIINHALLLLYCLVTIINRIKYVLLWCEFHRKAFSRYMRQCEEDTSLCKIFNYSLDSFYLGLQYDNGTRGGSSFIYLCVCGMYTYVCSCMCTQMHMHVGPWRWFWWSFLDIFPPYFLAQSLSLNLKPLCWDRLASQ